MKKIFSFLIISLLILIFIALETDFIHYIYRHLKIENNTPYPVDRIVLEINANGNKKRLPLGMLNANEDVRIPLDAPDSTILMEYFLRQTKYRIPCGYTSNDVSHRLRIMGAQAICKNF